jgi:hypothetical protein
MNPDLLNTALKEMAERWETPTFDPEMLAQHGHVRTRRARHRLLATVAVVVVAGSGVVAAVALTGPDDSHNTATNNTSLRPAIPPPARVRAVDTTGERIDGTPVLARVPSGGSVTVHARLSFLGKQPAAVKDAGLLVGKPGTYGGVGGTDVDSYYRDRHLEIVRGTFVTATSPEQRILSVTTPDDLPPGQYPVFSVYKSVLLPGQERGIQGPYNVSGQVGVIVITSK